LSNIQLTHDFLPAPLGADREMTENETKQLRLVAEKPSESFRRTLAI
jgi:hypothetical protein